MITERVQQNPNEPKLMQWLALETTSEAKLKHHLQDHVVEHLHNDLREAGDATMSMQR